jgi:hypothetical protein
MLGGILTHFLRNFHRAEFRATHGTKMRQLVRFLRQGLVVVFTSGIGIEAQIELVIPTKLKAGFRQSIVTNLRTRMALGQISGMRRNLVGNDAIFNVFLVREDPDAP